jgi:hypothetical protein
LHVETASRHLLRGQDQGESTAFTDAIYRTNQAFEGSLKEAYRVLAEKNPEKKNPYEIEVFFERNSVFRQRVLAQFTNYRKEWRNPSAHDYKLDFDESEAFLAIVSVAAFACLVLDQIAEKIAYSKVKAESDTRQAEFKEKFETFEEVDFLGRVANIFREFSRQQSSFNAEGLRLTELQVIGQLEGFIASVAPSLKVITEYKVRGSGSKQASHIRADLIISDDDSRVIVEVKKASRGQSSVDRGVGQLAHYITLSGINWAVLFLFSDLGGELETQEIDYLPDKGKILVLKPKTKISG